MRDIWYTIFNPESGAGLRLKHVESIKNLLSFHQINHVFRITQYAHHEEKLVENAIKKGYRKFICIGGDGTLHYIINGVMKQNTIASDKISIAVIPTGTGNDWVKTYKISPNPKKAIQTIVNNKFISQDIGSITFKSSGREVYFANTAGIGFDAYVVKNIDKYIKLGSLSYIVGALIGLKQYRPSNFSLKTPTQNFTSTMFLVSIGLCKYSGSGMQLTDYNHHKKGFFDITYISKIKRRNVLRHLLKLYFGGIKKIKESQCFREKYIDIKKNTSSYIQADGELIGSGDVSIRLIPKAIKFIIS